MAQTKKPAEQAPTRFDLSRREVLQRGAAVGGVMAVGGGLSAFLSACGSDDSTTDGSSVTADQVANATGTIPVLTFAFYQVPIPGTQVNAKYGTAAATDEMVTKTRSENAPFDVVDVDGGIAQQLRALDRLTPIDTDLLSNYDSVSASLRDFPAINADGNTYAVPFSGAVGLTAWDDSLVPEPADVTDLSDSAYSGQIALLNDHTSLTAFAFGLGLDGNNLTQDGLNQVIDLLDAIKPNVKTLYTFGDEIQLFGRGDIGVANLSFGSLLLEAQKANGNVKANYAGAQTYLDSYAILTGADEPAPLNWIDAVISPAGQKAILEASGGLPSVEAARVPGTQPEIVEGLSNDEVVEKAPIYPGFPVEADGDLVTLDEATSAWDDFKSSFS